MINITFGLPYPELADEVDVVFQRHPRRSRINKKIRILSADQLDSCFQEMVSESDVLIGRGYTAQRLIEKKSEIPIITLPITAYDIIRAINECLNLYQPQHIAFIGNSISTIEAEAIAAHCSCRFSVYHAAHVEEISLKMSYAIKDGCDAFIGGYSVSLCAKKNNKNFVTIKTGESAVRLALDEAIRTVEILREERERTALYSIITNSAKDGIIYVANDLVIQVANPASIRYCQRYRKPVGESLTVVFPFMTAAAAEAITSGKENENQLYNHEGTLLSINYFPVIVQDKVTGIVITFQDITKIQKLETQIRQKLSEKGLTARYYFKDIIHVSSCIDRLIETARRYAATPSNVIIVGETGTGKELLAQGIHNESKRSQGPFVAVNCAAIPENLLESEMFGYVEGAFTGSSRGGKIGLFEQAHNGTLFLDEVSELPLGFQSKLLRVLQEREVRPVGANRVKSVDVRIIAASNCELSNLMKQGKFRHDLYYRLVVLKLRIPPLRQRLEDVDVLFLHFLREHSNNKITKLSQIEPKAVQLLRSYDYAGNIREMRNIAERISIQCMYTETITAVDVMNALDMVDLSDTIQSGKTDESSIKNILAGSERELIIEVLQKNNNNKSQTARELEMDRSTLWRKMNKYNISS